MRRLLVGFIFPAAIVAGLGPLNLVKAAESNAADEVGFSDSSVKTNFKSDVAEDQGQTIEKKKKKSTGYDS